MTTTQARLSLAGVVATLLAALTLSPLVQGKAWLVASFVVVAVVAGVGAAVRQVTRSWPLVALAQLAALVLTITALFARGTALWGVLPGPAAVGTLRDLLRTGLEIADQDGPPVEAAAGMLLLVAGGIGLVGLVVDVAAAGLRKPAVAGLPLLAVYCVPAAVLPDGVGWGWFVLAGLGYLLLIAADATDRVRGWGRVLGTLGPDGGGTFGSGPLSGARRIGIGALAVAVLVPPLVPGLGEQMLGSGSGSGPGNGNREITVVNPILNLREDLQQRSSTPILTYRLDEGVDPQPLRIVAVTRYDGTVWSPPTGEIPADNRVQDGLPSPPGLGATIETTTRQVRLEAGDYAQRFLPLPYPATSVDVEGTWLWDPGTLNVVGEDSTTQDRVWSASYLEVAPTPEQLDAAGSGPPTLVQEYTRLPDTFPVELRRIARRVAGNGSPYEQATNLQRYFRSDEFTYSTDAPGSGPDDGSQDILLQFLEVKRGYCVHFASAMAVMARALGIPARVAVGFLPGDRAADGSYRIAPDDAHAWPELYFEGTGWVRFEPTPGARAGAPGYTQGVEPQAEPSPQPSASASAAPEQSARPEQDVPQEETGAAQSPLVERVVAAVPWRVVAGVLALGLLLLVPLAAAVVVRRRRWSRAGTAQARAEAAWDDLRERLADLGVRWAASWTPRALRRRLTAEHALDGAQDAALGRLVAALEEARYMPPGAPGRDVEELAADVRVVVDGVAAGVPGAVRRRARWLPSSGVGALSRLVRSADAAADEAGRRAAALGEQVRATVGAGRRER